MRRWSGKPPDRSVCEPRRLLACELGGAAEHGGARVQCYEVGSIEVRGDSNWRCRADMGEQREVIPCRRSGVGLGGVWVVRDADG